jgi:hypothetical protein
MMIPIGQDGSAVRKLIILQVQQSSVQDMAMAKHMERMRIVARRSFKSKFIHDRYLWGSLQ